MGIKLHLDGASGGPPGGPLRGAHLCEEVQFLPEMAYSGHAWCIESKQTPFLHPFVNSKVLHHQHGAHPRV